MCIFVLVCASDPEYIIENALYEVRHASTKNHDYSKQAMQFGLPVPQPRQNIEDMRPGVWDVDEYNQYAKRAPSPSAIRAFEALQLQKQQQQQQQQQRLQSQLSYPGQMKQDLHDVFGFDQSPLINPNLMEPRMPMNMYDPSLRRERSMSAINSSLAQMDGELAAQIQEQKQQARAERQNSLPTFNDTSSDMERYRQDMFDLRQVQERQQQVEAAAAARVLGMSTNSSMDRGESGRPKSRDRRTSQLDASGNSALLPGLLWPIMRDEPSPHLQESLHDIAQSLGGHPLWGRETHDFGGLEQMQGGSRSGTTPPTDYIPILPTPSTAGTPRSSVSGTPPEPLHMPGSWGLSTLPPDDLLTSQFQANDNLLHHHGGSSAPFAHGGWKPLSSKSKSFAEIQHDEAIFRKTEEQTSAEANARSLALPAPTSSGGFDPWAAPSFQSKSLQEIQEEESRKASTFNSQLKSSMFSQKISGSRGDHLSSWGSSSATEKSSSLFEVGEEPLGSQTSRRSFELETSIVNQTALGLSSQSLSQSSSAFDDSDFIEPKEAKKNKKRPVKAKGAAPVGKSSVSVALSEVSQLVSPHSSIQNSATRLGPSESFEDNLSAAPGSSLADFFSLQEEAVAFSQALPPWSLTASRQAKGVKSLKEIQEAEKRERQHQMLQASIAQQQFSGSSVKPITLMTRTGSGSGIGGSSAWQRPSVRSPSPQSVMTGQQSKVLTHSLNSPGIGSGNLRSKVGVFEDDDDMFWDYSRDAKLNTGAIKQLTKPEM